MYLTYYICYVVVTVQLLSHVQLLRAHGLEHARLSCSSLSPSLLSFMSTESVMLSTHPILCHPLLLPLVFCSISLFQWLGSYTHTQWWRVTTTTRSDTPHIFFIHSSADGHLGCFHVLTVVSSGAVNIAGCILTSPWWSLFCFLSLWLWRLWETYINGVIQYLSFCVRLLIQEAQCVPAPCR